MANNGASFYNIVSGLKHEVVDCRVESEKGLDVNGKTALSVLSDRIDGEPREGVVLLKDESARYFYFTVRNWTSYRES